MAHAIDTMADPMDAAATEAADMLKSLGNPGRLRLLATETYSNSSLAIAGGSGGALSLTVRLGGSPSALIRAQRRVWRQAGGPRGGPPKPAYRTIYAGFRHSQGPRSR